MPTRAMLVLLAKGMIAVPEVLPPWLRRVAHTLALVGGMAAFVYTVATALGFEAHSTGQRVTAVEGNVKMILKVVDTLHQADAALDDRLERIERIGCVQLSIREREISGTCYGRPLSPERIRKVP